MYQWKRPQTRNNKINTILVDLHLHSEKYFEVSISMIKTNIEFFAGYNGIELSEYDKQEILNKFINETHLIISK